MAALHATLKPLLQQFPDLFFADPLPNLLTGLQFCLLQHFLETIILLMSRVLQKWSTFSTRHNDNLTSVFLHAPGIWNWPRYRWRFPWIVLQMHQPCVYGFTGSQRPEAFTFFDKLWEQTLHLFSSFWPLFLATMFRYKGARVGSNLYWRVGVFCFSMDIYVLTAAHDGFILMARTDDVFFYNYYSADWYTGSVLVLLPPGVPWWLTLLRILWPFCHGMLGGSTLSTSYHCCFNIWNYIIPI